MEHKLPELPYSNDALAPHISPETIEYHYGKHHNAYVTKLNAGIKGTEFEEMTLEDIIKSLLVVFSTMLLLVWNHTFYRNRLRPNKGGAATGAIADKIIQVGIF